MEKGGKVLILRHLIRSPYLPTLLFFFSLIKHWNLLHLIKISEGNRLVTLIYLRLMFPKIDTLLDILLLMISVLSYWSRLYQHQMPAKPSYSASNNPGNRRKVKSREYGCIWWINTNNYALLAVSSNSNIRTQVGIFFMGFI